MQISNAFDAYTIKDKDMLIVSVDCRTVILHREYFPYFVNGTLDEVYAFLADRVFSASRRDREANLYHLGLSDYDVLAIAKKTHAFSTQDTLWLSTDDTLYSDALNSFLSHLHDCTYSPGGVNIKSYLKKGIKKKRLSPMHSDAEMEVVCYRLGVLLGMPVCRAEMMGSDHVLSYFEYNIFIDRLVHVRHLIDMTAPNLHDELMRNFDNTWLNNLMVFDFLTRQDDRHMSNLATLNGKLYPLYDNGRSLFYEDTPETVANMLLDVRVNATSFGNIGTYWDYAHNTKHTLNLVALTPESVSSCFAGLSIPDYRKEGAIHWILSAKEALLCN